MGGDRLIIYGSGSTVLGRYLATKDIQSAEIANFTGGIRINWGDGSFQNLPGDSWDVQSQSLDRIRWRLGVTASGCRVGLSYWYKILSGASYSLSSRYTFPNVGCGGAFFSYTLNRPPLPPQLLTMNYDSWDGTPNDLSIQGTDTEAFYDDASNKSDSWSYFPPQEHQRIFWGTDIIIQTNIGAVAQKFIVGNYPPPEINRLPNGCGLNINFVDGSSRQIPVNPCPTWVQIKPQNACPEGTVRECHHGATVCCYGCQDGRLVLLDSFNKSQ